MQDAEAITPAYLADGQPDWSAIDFEVRCGRCDYNLRMLPEPRCPECGLHFDWQTVLTAAAWRSDFLFEHHWRGRPLRSWLVTIWRAFRPKRFWSTVSIHSRVHAGPLWLMLLTSVIAFYVCLHGTAALGWLAADAIAARQASPFAPASLAQSLAWTLRHIASLPFQGDDGYYAITGGLLITPLAALGLLCTLHQTLGRCRVRRVQVLRVTAYSATPVTILWGLGAVLLVVMLQIARKIGLAPPERAVGLLALLYPPTILAIFLRAGLKHYLQLPRATLLAVTAVFVAFLFAFTVCLRISLA